MEKPSEEKMMEIRNKACLAYEERTQDDYAGGVADALSWVLGEQDDPMKEYED